MNRRAYIAIFGAVIAGTLPGCSLSSRCHSGQFGPPKGLRIINRDYTTEARRVSIVVQRADSNETVLSETPLLNRDQSKTYRDILSEPGRYQVDIITRSTSNSWTDTTQTCGGTLFNVLIREDSIAKQEPGVV